MPLTPAMRAYLDGVDKSDLMTAVDLGDLEYHVRRLMKKYPLAETTLATLLMELVQGVQEQIEVADAEHEDGTPTTKEEVVLAVHNWMTSYAIMAAAMTRKARGRPPLWQS